MKHGVELGLVSFGDVVSAPKSPALSQAQVIRNVVEEGVVADQAGVDFLGLGEHHRADFAISSPEIVLAAIAARTERIVLGTAVTVLGTDEPVRVFQRFATLSAISHGRVEFTVGRGAFTESFSLFGYDLHQYDELFEDKLDLLISLLTGNPVNWSGWSRTPLEDQYVYPGIENDPPRIWVGVGGDVRSAVRAARYNLPLILASIGGSPARFSEHIGLYRKYHEQLGRPAQHIGIYSPGYIAETDERAREEYYPDYKHMRDSIATERGWPLLTGAEFEDEIDHGSLYVGSPDTVARKIAKTVETLDLNRFALRYSAGPLSHDKMRRCIELYGNKVAPHVRDMLS